MCIRDRYYYTDAKSDYVGGTGTFYARPNSDSDILTYSEMCFIKAEVLFRPYLAAYDMTAVDEKTLTITTPEVYPTLLNDLASPELAILDLEDVYKRQGRRPGRTACGRPPGRPPPFPPARRCR